MNPAAIAAANARYEAEPTTANLKEALYEGLQEVFVVFRGVEDSFAEMIAKQESFPVYDHDSEAARQLLLQQFPDNDIQNKEFRENMEVLLSAVDFLVDGGEPLQGTGNN